MHKATSLLAVGPGKLDEVAFKPKSVAGVKNFLSVTGRADVVAIYDGTYEKIVEMPGKVGTLLGVTELRPRQDSRVQGPVGTFLANESCLEPKTNPMVRVVPDTNFGG